MAGDKDGAGRRVQDGTAVSSGDSSAATTNPALGSEGMTLPGIDSADVTLAGVPTSSGPPQAASTPRSDPSDAVTIVESSGSGGSSTPHPIFSSIGATIFPEGDVLGGRYEIQKLLGMGGMGAVYKARDMEVERVVGLKVIRPDLAGDPAILARFKQELVLARQVTHKNIIRIYDLNEADGVKFITMEFIEGEDLRTILTRQGKLSAEESVSIIIQVCAGLQAAHSEGVIHRDLKPSNIMRDGAGRVVIMDFGLARTVQGDGMTRTGMMIGTMEYMSPEQAMGKELDARSDEFAVGLILYELLSGFIPFQADSAIASLVKRTQEQATPLTDVDSSVPVPLSNIVSKCLERDPNGRFNSVQELIDQLEIWQGKKAGQTVSAPVLPSAAAPAKRLPWKWIVVAAAVVVLAIGAVVGIRSGSGAGGAPAAVKGPVTSLAIIPFQNGSGDPSLDWLSSSLSENLSSDMGQSAHLHLVSPARLQQVLHDLHISPQSQLDLSQLKRIAEFTNANTVVFGQYAKFGDQIRVNATVNDLKNDRQYQVATDVASEKDLLAGLTKLAEEVRQKLASSPELLKELQSQTPFVLTKSVPALRAYDQGLQLSRSGKEQEAAKKFEEATEADPNFAMAYSQLAKSYQTLGFDDKAEQTSRRAVTLSDGLPARERYLIEATHARIMNQPEKAIEAYQNITQANPSDTDAQFALAGLYEDARNFDEARKCLAKVRAADGKNVYALLASGRVELRAGNAQAGLEFLNPAYSLAMQLDNEEVKASIEQAMGVAYEQLGKLDEALRNMQDALAIRKKLGLQRDMASSLYAIAGVQDTLGNSAAAFASYKEALAVLQQIGDKHGIATTLMNLGATYNDHAQYDEALKNLNDALTRFRELGDEPAQATVLNNIGTARFSMGEFQDALTYFQQAYQLREKLKLSADMTQSLHNLAETNVKLGQYDTALSQYLKALDSGRASADQSVIGQESSSLGALFATQGKYDAALKSLQEAMKQYQQANDHTWLMAETQARYGDVLSQVGRFEEGQKQLEDALKVAADVKNNTVTAEALNWLGDSYFYRGDYAAARQQYEKAAAVAAKAKIREQVAVSKFGLARLDVVQGRSTAAIPALQKLVQESDASGLKALSVQASNYLAQALEATGKTDAARQELDRALNRAEKLGLLVEQARAHYLLAQAFDKTGKASQSTPQYREAVKLLESISKEDGASRLLERSDLKDIYHEATKSYQGAA
ncbi:MAG: tetratricopeptide repeat protein [Acidobacteriota bacterium]|nr:tetratricopeptide repeat protein [Acidobacteriota bacterium]